jgi:diguanylate cyclase (GGDEF)-like protein/PAS domain S-box-containing protein
VSTGELLAEVDDERARTAATWCLLVVCVDAHGGSSCALAESVEVADAAVTIVHGSDAALRHIHDGRPDVVLVVLDGESEDDLVLLGEIVVLSPNGAVVAIGPTTTIARAVSSGVTTALDAADIDADELRETLIRSEAEPLSRRLRHAAGEHRWAIESSLNEGFFVISRSGRIIELNAATGTILGYPPDALRFINIFENEFTWRAEDGTSYGVEDAPVGIALRTGTHVPPMLQSMEFADGSVHYVESSATPLFRSGEGEPYAAVATLRDVTEEHKTQSELLAAQGRRWLLFEHASEGHLIVGPDRRIIEASSSIIRFWPEEWVIGRDGIELIHPDDRDLANAIFNDVATGGGAPRKVEIRIVSEHGDVRWTEATITSRFDEPSIGGAVVHIWDITNRRRLQRERELAEQQFRLGFDLGAIGMMMLDLSGIITEVNAAFCEMIRYASEEVIGHPAEEFIHPDDRAARRLMFDRVYSGEQDDFLAERRLVRSDGKIVYTLSGTAAVRDADGNVGYLFSQVQDISELRESAEEIERQARTDALTGLPNRLALDLRLADLIAREHADGRAGALLFLDVDRFKLVNDGLGHSAGDKVLVAVARRLEIGMRPTDTVARFGGDEFVVVCEDVRDTEHARAIGERVLTLLDEPVDVDGKLLRLSVSCGITLIDGQRSAEEVLRDADAAMYQAKERGRDRVEIFDDSLREAVTSRLEIEQQLRAALDKGELRVAYQTIVTIPEGALVGLEALVRWEHPTRGLLLPYAFVPAAEESGLISAIGEFVLEEALRQILVWRAERPEHASLWVSVNMSSREFALGDPVGMCMRLLSETGAPPDALHIELTESAVMSDVAASIRSLEALRDLGISVAIDDFGTGYSSLAYLSQLPVALLKIDRSFIDGLTSDGGDAMIARAIMMLARGLQVDVCAEGVESAEQLAILTELGCTLGQGYYWSVPRFPSEFVWGDPACTSAS